MKTQSLDSPGLTAAQVINQLGGTDWCMARYGVGESAVSNWRKRGFPERLHLQIQRDCQAGGIDYDPTRAPARRFGRQAAA